MFLFIYYNYYEQLNLPIINKPEKVKKTLKLVSVFKGYVHFCS